MASFLTRLKERKVVQWTLTYVAAAWVVYEATGTAFETWNLPALLIRSIHVLLLFGLFATLVVAWYHGERGRQRVSGPELLILALLLALLGLGLSFLNPRGSRTDSEALVASEEDELEDLRQRPSLAVLPFENRSGAPEDQYFVDGFHDELLTRLQRAQGLLVLARQAVEGYRDSSATPQEIGQELSVRYLLEGGVQRAGVRIRVNLQLIDARTAVHLWGDIFDTELTTTTEDLLNIQTEMVRAVAGELDITLRAEEAERAARRSTRDSEAYDLFVRGRDARERARDGEAFRAAEGLFERAAERDPTFVVAHAALSETRSMIFQFFSHRSREVADAARSAAERAVELDPTSEDAQLAMGIFFYRVEADYAEALEWLGQASSNLRGNLEFHRFQGYSQRRLGKWREAVSSLKVAASLSPRDATALRELGVTLSYMRRYTEADSLIREAITLEPPQTGLRNLFLIAWKRDGSTDVWQAFLDQYPSPFWEWALQMVLGDYRAALACLDEAGDAFSPTTAQWYPKALLAGWSHTELGDAEWAHQEYTQAAFLLETLVEEAPLDERYHHALGLVYAGLGRREEAAEEVQIALDLCSPDRDAWSSSYHLLAKAAVHGSFGEVAEAIAVLERLLTVPSPFAAGNLRSHYLLKSLQHEPAFQELLEREPGRVF